MAKKPETAAEWRTHAEEMHGFGLTCVDARRGQQKVPTDVAAAAMAEAQMYFTAAQSATAMAAFVASLESARSVQSEEVACPSSVTSRTSNG